MRINSLPASSSLKPLYSPLLCIVAMLIGFSCTTAIYTANFNVLEELPQGTVIGSLVSRLPQALKDKLAKLRFRVIQSEQAQYFQVNVTTGELRIKSRLDRETICPSLIEEAPLLDTLRHGATTADPQCELSFRVNVLRLTRSGVEIENLIKVFIQLEDIDDNRCRFLPSDRQELHIPENTKGIAVALNVPVDLDTKLANNIAQSSIRLVTGAATNNTNPFRLLITKSDSLISPYGLQLVVNESLDYERTRTYQILVIASGLAPNSECRLGLKIHVLDCNDHPPTFVQKTARVFVQENTTVGQPIYVAKATDADSGPIHGSLRFSLSPFNPPQMHLIFGVDEYNGSVYLKSPLHYADNVSYKLSLRVTNPDMENDALVKANPVYTAPASIEQLSIHNKHTESADYMDLHVNVIDVNDKRPEIVIYALNGSRQLTLVEHTESIPADFAVVSVTDEDSGLNGQVSCHLEDPHSNWFELTRIDQKQSVITVNTTDTGNGGKGALYKLAALRSFDRETDSSVAVNIFCEDHGEPKLESNSTGILTILDINDHNPEFTQSTIHLRVAEDTDPERQINDYVISQLNATDRDIGDNGRIRYSLVDPNAQERFRVDAQTGLLRSNGMLRYDGNKTIVFSVWATDLGSVPRSTSVEIQIEVTDYNDHAPKFNLRDYHFQVAENLPKGVQVGSFRVCDGDAGTNAVVNFHLSPPAAVSTIVDGDFQSGLIIPFRLVSQYESLLRCYEVNLVTTASLDREAHLQKYNRSWLDHLGDPVYHPLPYEFDVVAQDRGTPQQTARARIRVSVDDVNDEAPVFLRPPAFHRSFIVTANQPVGWEIFQVYAVDRDEGVNGTVQYFLGTASLYESDTDKNVVKQCDKATLERVLRPRQTALNLLHYFHLNTTTGVFSVRTAISDQLVDTTCRVTILAKDRGPAPLETAIDVCLTISEASWVQVDGGFNRTTLVAANQTKPRARNARAMLYLYIIAAVSILGLIASVAFVLSAYFLWHRPRSKPLQTRSNVIRFNDVNTSGSGLTCLDKVEFPPVYAENTTADGSGGALLEWTDTVDGEGQYGPTWSSMRYATVDSRDRNPMVCHGFADAMNDFQNVNMHRLPYSPTPQTMYYHTMGNPHAMDCAPMQRTLINY